MFSKPLILASGILGVKSGTLIRIGNKESVGAVTTKSFNLLGKKGHESPIIIKYRNNLLNAVGLSNSGCDKMLEEIKKYKEKCNTPIIASVFGSNKAEYTSITEKIIESVDGIELNLSCPNIAGFTSYSYVAPSNIIHEFRKINPKIPIFAKFSLQQDRLVDMINLCEDKGVTAIVLSNSISSGMIIDINMYKPILSNKCGGMSGPSIFPLALKAIYDIYPKIKVPIIGCGGITTWRDAIQMFLAGARYLQIGSAIHFRGIDVFDKIDFGVRRYLNEKNCSLEDLIGLAHENI